MRQASSLTRSEVKASYFVVVEWLPRGSEERNGPVPPVPRPPRRRTHGVMQEGTFAQLPRQTAAPESVWNGVGCDARVGTLQMEREQMLLSI